MENILGTHRNYFLTLKGTEMRTEDIVHDALPLTNMYAKYITCVMIRIKLLTNIVLFRVNKGLHYLLLHLI